jgi:hypothetical protein
MAWNKGEHDRPSFAKVMKAFEGERFPFTPGGSKILRFLLERPEGGDIWLSSERFETHSGWYSSRYQSPIDEGPGVISRLLYFSMAPVGPSVQAVIGPRDVPAIGGLEVIGETSLAYLFPAWSFGLRRLWIEATSTEVIVRVRNAEAEDKSQRATPCQIPGPIEVERRVLEFPNLVPCPKCAVGSRTFRQLRDGYLICAACGGSFAVDAV